MRRALIAAFVSVALVHAEPGVRGGRLTVAERAEPKTLNPIIAVDVPSKEIIGTLMADLVHINRETQQAEPALAESWEVSNGGRRYTLHLRKGLRFSDGHPLDADDVVFSFRVYLDERVHAPQRDLLILDGKPIAVSRQDGSTVVVDLPQAYAAGERLFDSFAILPRHLLENAWTGGRVADVWTVNTPAAQIAGAGPFRLKEHVPGARLVVERNPYYWKNDSKRQQLPYVDELVFTVVPTEDAQILRLQAGESDVVSRLGADNFDALNLRGDQRLRLIDAGPGLETNFLFFNLNDPPASNAGAAMRHEWFADESFRHAVSLAIDRSAIVRLVYRGRATAIASPVSPGNRQWVNKALRLEPRSVERARGLLKTAGYGWTNGRLIDRRGRPVAFTIVTAASNAARTKMATLIQADLADLDIDVQVVPLEFRAMIARVLDSKDYDAAIFGLASGDADPNADMNVWLSSGAMHLWRPSQSTAATPWEAEIDRLMKSQITTVDRAARKRMFDRVQELLVAHVPLIPLVTPDVLVATSSRVANVRPAALDPVALWNVDELFWRPAPRGGTRP